MRKLLAVGVCVLALAGCDLRQVVKLGPAMSVRCTEDMACWDCHTMGNHVCGLPVTS